MQLRDPPRTAACSLTKQSLFVPLKAWGHFCAHFLLTSFLEVRASNTRLVKILCVHSVQCMEQAVSGGVISPIAQVQTPNECHQPPLGSLITHVGMWGRLSMGGRTVVAGAPPPKPFQLVLGPVALAIPT